MSWSEGWQTWEAMPGVTIEIFHAKGANASRAYALITGGIHGDEYEGPAAALEFIKQLDPTALQGSLTVVPVANPPAFAAGTRTNPDGRNLARCFPGTHGGSDTERLAHAIFHHLLEGVTHLIDLHSGGVEYIFLPVAGFYGDASSSNRSFAAARRFGLPHLWRLPDTPGVLSCEAYKRGAVAIGCEYLGAGQLSTEGVAAYRSGIARCLASWQIIDAPTRVESPTSIFEGDWQLAEHDGIVRNFIRIKQQVKAGDLLCRIDDLRGEPVQEVRAQDAGIVGGVRSKAYIRKGNWAVMVLRQIS